MKATFGLYNYMLGDTYADAFNRNATANAVFTWHDLNGDKLYQPGEVNLDLNSADFRSITAASNRILNPNLKSPNNWETTASCERELAANMGIRVMYVNKLVSGSIVNSTNNLVSINTLRPFSAWSVPITRRDPGPDGILGNARRRGERDALRLHRRVPRRRVRERPDGQRHQHGSLQLDRGHADEAVLVEVDGRRCRISR